MTRECTGVCYFTWGWACETVGNFYTTNREKSMKLVENPFDIWCNQNLPSFLHSGTWSAHMQTRASRSYANPGEHWYRLASPFQQFQKTSHLFSSAKMPYKREQWGVEIAGSILCKRKRKRFKKIFNRIGGDGFYITLAAVAVAVTVVAAMANENLQTRKWYARNRFPIAFRFRKTFASFTINTFHTHSHEYWFGMWAWSALSELTDCLANMITVISHTCSSHGFGWWQ